MGDPNKVPYDEEGADYDGKIPNDEFDDLDDYEESEEDYEPDEDELLEEEEAWAEEQDEDDE